MLEAPSHIIRIGVVNYLNTLPLIDGLEGLADFHLVHDVPSRLLGHLLKDEVDIALCSSFDYQVSGEPLVIIPGGLLGCDGSTMTVRLFSQVPTKRIGRVYCDTDSHTSVNLLRVLLHEVYGIEPELVHFDARTHINTGEDSAVEWPESMLLIGDKVVTDATPAIRYPYQIDLGAEWFELTGLPFVFAMWMMKKPAEGDLESIAIGRTAGAVFDHQRRRNAELLEVILRKHIERCGWPYDLARSYVTEMIQYEWTERAETGLQRFFDYCYNLKLINKNRAVEFIS